MNDGDFSSEEEPKENETALDVELTVLSAEVLPTESSAATEVAKKTENTIAISRLKHAWGLLKHRLKKRKYQTEYVALFLTLCFLWPWYTVCTKIADADPPLPLNEAVACWFAFFAYVTFFVGVIFIIQWCLFPVLFLFTIWSFFYTIDFTYWATLFFKPDYILRGILGETKPMFENETFLNKTCGEFGAEKYCKNYYVYFFLMEAGKSLAYLIFMVGCTSLLAFVAKDYVKTQDFLKPHFEMSCNGIEEEKQFLNGSIDSNVIVEVVQAIIRAENEAGILRNDIEAGNTMLIKSDNRNALTLTDEIKIVDEE